MSEEAEKIVNQLDEQHGAVKPLKARLAQAAAEFKKVRRKEESSSTTMLVLVYDDGSD